MNVESQSPENPATLYYDGQCPLCMKEMARLGRLKNEQLQLADIHQLGDASGLPERDVLLRTLHLRLPDGQLLTGVDANVAAWGYTRYGIWFRWMRWPVLRYIADRVYRSWARWRYDRLYATACATEGGRSRCDPHSDPESL